MTNSTATNTETTFEKKNLVSDSIGYLFHYKRAPKTKFATKYQGFVDYI